MISVNRVFGECALAVGKGIERGKEGSAGLELDLDAADFWSKRYIKSIRNALKKGSNWDQARRTVLLMAERLGIAAARAAQKSGSQTIQLAHATEASVKIEGDKRCASPPPGSGRYCEMVVDEASNL